MESVPKTDRLNEKFLIEIHLKKSNKTDENAP